MSTYLDAANVDNLWLAVNGDQVGLSAEERLRAYGTALAGQAVEGMVLYAGTEAATAVVGLASQSVWQLGNDARGVAIENMLGRSPQLVQNFPVIDRFENGLATSIKSIDLRATTYQNVGNLMSKVKGDVTKLAEWPGATRGGATIQSVDITGRKLLLAIPPGATKDQMDALKQLADWATNVGVELETIVVQ